MSTGRRVFIATGAVLGLAALIVAGTLIRRPVAGAPARARPATTTVVRQTLVDVTSADGTLGHGPEQPIESRLTGTVTRLPAIGARLDRGQVLFRVDDQPVVLMLGPLPAYRALTAGNPAAVPAVPATEGADVEEFETNLKALGYHGFTVDDRYTQATATAVREWQEDLDLPPTGVVELGRVLYAPAAIRVAKLKTNLGAVTSGPVLTCTSDVRLVTAEVPEHDRALAKAGTAMTILLPTGGEVPGRVLSVRTPDSDGPEPTVEVVVRPNDPARVGDLDDGPVRVRFVKQRRANVLVVPVGALLALAEGGYGLEIVDDAGSRIVPVTTGLFADGRVEVSGIDIDEGTTVGMAK